MTNSKIVITMPLRNGAKTIRRAVESVVMQDVPGDTVELVIANDASDDDWHAEIADLMVHLPTAVLDVNCGTTHAVRNYLRTYVGNHYEEDAYIARLDCDDELTDPYVLKRIMGIMAADAPDVIFCGNGLRKDNVIQERVNHATADLGDMDYLLSRLKRMCECDATAELPSCNTIIKNTVDFHYPDVQSAEDHWLTVDLLLRQHELRIHFAETLIYCIYSLSGSATENNVRQGHHRASRLKLLDHFIERVDHVQAEN